MKIKLLKLHVMLLFGLSLTPLQGQTTMNVKATGGTQTPYALSTIRKLTFSGTGNMNVTKTSGSTDNYELTSVRYLNFGDLSTGIAAKKETSGFLQLYPNPVVDVLHIQLADAGSQTVSVELFSIEGKVLYKAQLTTTANYQVNVSQFRQGIYLCRINNGTSIETTKFFKK